MPIRAIDYMWMTEEIGDGDAQNEDGDSNIGRKWPNNCFDGSMGGARIGGALVRS